MNQQVFLSGDRVEYVGEARSLRGEVGTVDEQVSTATVRVRWDTRSRPMSIYSSSLRLVSRPLPDTNESQVGVGSASDPLYEALQRLIKAKRAHKAAERQKSAALKDEARAQDLFNKALADAAKE